MEYNLTDRQRAAVTWMVETNRNGELDDEFSALWVLGSAAPMLINTNTGTSVDAPEDMTQGVLDGLHSEGLIQQTIKYQTKVKKSGTTQSEQGRRCTLTRRAFEAVDSDFVMPDPQPSGPVFNIHGNVSQSIVGTQTRAELTNNMDFGGVRERIELEGGEDKEELSNALDHVERLVERGEYLNRGELSRFSRVMEDHSWFTGAVMSALLGFATQAIT